MEAWSLVEPHQRVLRMGDLRVSFQLLGGVQAATGAPVNLGAVRLGERKRSRAREVLLPLRENDTFWVGLEAEGDAVVAVRVVVQEPQSLDAVTGEHPLPRLVHTPANCVTVPPAYGVFEIANRGPFDARRAARFKVTGTPSRAARGRRAWKDAQAVSASVRVVSYEMFEQLTGIPPGTPLNESGAYQGWRLP
jgi:hypothetical protein